MIGEGEIESFKIVSFKRERERERWGGGGAKEDTEQTWQSEWL